MLILHSYHSKLTVSYYIYYYNETVDEVIITLNIMLMTSSM